MICKILCECMSNFVNFKVNKCGCTTSTFEAYVPSRSFMDEVYESFQTA